MAIRRHILNRRKEDPTHKAIIHLGANIFEYRTEQEQEIYYWDDEELQFTKNEKLWIGRVSSLADEALQSLLMLENTIIVTDAGIWKKGIPIVTWPAIHGPLFKSLVVVGSVDTAGNLAFHREEDFVKVYAIGYGVEVPFFRRRNDFSVLQNGYESAKDSRHAAAAIVGILATHLSSNKDWDTTAAVDKLYNDAYSRVRNGPKVAWTGVRPPTAGCKRQREDEDGEEGDKKVKLEDSECSGDQIQS
ncbi:uncharacterized protein DFL_000419 [Arthrobotrys flagrans]|uniref:Peptidase S8/S53 domain-containing protein n=1 Tax=Arthrobotrys flagrans TaxID=97331 RepID=A0A437ADQ3_ARTFL|nr:hypothetical protein DFL_000419 [Arthrobotrys flagrans]